MSASAGSPGQPVPGGTGEAKCGGNYATSLVAQAEAIRRGCDQVVFLDAVERKWVDELGGMNIFFVRDGKTLITPPRSHGILAGTTQRALFEVAEDKGYTCEYAPLFPADLITAGGVWLVSSVTLAARVHTLDGLPLDEPAANAEFVAMVNLAVETIGTQLRS